MPTDLLDRFSLKTFSARSVADNNLGLQKRPLINISSKKMTVGASGPTELHSSLAKKKPPNISKKKNVDTVLQIVHEPRPVRRRYSSARQSARSRLTKPGRKRS